uniref:Uncharacterized protein n=1 Tax=Vespula pensylvanica TaxID=30213 RepID=A0A834UES0_VESPE|nr:hypothetical protein H0235_003063 [Vespula pensylvanica]
MSDAKGLPWSSTSVDDVLLDRKVRRIKVVEGDREVVDVGSTCGVIRPPLGLVRLAFTGARISLVKWKSMATQGFPRKVDAVGEVDGSADRRKTFLEKGNRKGGKTQQAAEMEDPE